jgi:hypothetical protein
MFWLCQPPRRRNEMLDALVSIGYGILVMFGLCVIVSRPGQLVIGFAGLILILWFLGQCARGNF